MRVLYLESPSGYGGSMQSLLDLLAYLPAEVEPIIAATYPPSAYRPLPDKLVVEVISPPLAMGRYAYLRLITYQLGWYRLARRLLNHFRPDLLVTNNTPLSVFGAAIAAARKEIPVLTYARGFVQSRRLLRKVSRYYHKCIAISQAVAQNLGQHGFPRGKCLVLYNPIKPPEDGALSCSEPAYEVGMVGMLQPWKGQHVFLEAIHLLNQRRNSLHAAIVGEEPLGTQGYKLQLLQLAAEYGIGQIVHFYGFVRDPFQLLRHWHIAVHASVEPEPFGRTIAEAMVAGVAVVATAGGGVPEFVEDGVTGLLVPMGDAASLAQAIETLLQQPQLRQELARRAKERSLEMFEPRRRALQEVEIYQKLVSRRG